jgi:S1-C subfamily serine protease
VIVAIDGEPTETLKDVKFAVLPHYAGDTLAVDYRRGEKQETATMTLVPPASLADEDEDGENEAGPVGGVR